VPDLFCPIGHLPQKGKPQHLVGVAEVPASAQVAQAVGQFVSEGIVDS